MSDSMIQKAPGWFMVVAILALLWNLVGVFSFIGQVTMTPEDLASFSQERQDLYNSIPTWVTAAFALSVGFGALGSLLLVLKKNLAGLFLQISLLAVLVQSGYNFFMTNALEVLGGFELGLMLVVISISVLLVILAAKAKRSHWTT